MYQRTPVMSISYKSDLAPFVCRFFPLLFVDEHVAGPR